MNFDVNEGLSEEIIRHYGAENSTIVAIEECSEVIKELTKFLRDKGNKENLEEEIADVMITLKHMCMIYGLDTVNIQNYIVCKQFREMRRIQGYE